MFRIINNLKNRKGFTLIELIVVLAVLALIMAIAIPRFSRVRDDARIDADKATAQQINKAARLMESKRDDGTVTTSGTTSGGNWDNDIMIWPSAQSYDSAVSGGADFSLSGGGTDPYVVTFTPNIGYNTTLQTVTEQQ
jgi:prepilin-type N-terminal cleavage/methylation domain-containing protein